LIFAGAPPSEKRGHSDRSDAGAARSSKRIGSTRFEIDHLCVVPPLISGGSAQSKNRPDRASEAFRPSNSLSVRVDLKRPFRRGDALKVRVCKSSHRGATVNL